MSLVLPELWQPAPGHKNGYINEEPFVAARVYRDHRSGRVMLCFTDARIGPLEGTSFICATYAEAFEKWRQIVNAELPYYWKEDV